MKIEVKRSKLGGRGVFAKQDIKRGEVIEKAEVLLIKPKERKHLDQTSIHHYYFTDDDCKISFLALGTGSLYNHSDDPNAKVEGLNSKNLLVYRARKPIKKGEEILIHYYNEPGVEADLWFKKKR